MTDGIYRYAGPADVQKITKIWKKCLPRQPLPIAYNEENAIQALLYEMSPQKKQDAVCFYTDNGVIGGYISVCAYNFSARIARALVFLSNGQDGMKLLKAFEQWSQAMGATHVSFETLSKEQDATRQRLLSSKGFVRAEQSWLKCLI